MENNGNGRKTNGKPSGLMDKPDYKAPIEINSGNRRRTQGKPPEIIEKTYSKFDNNGNEKGYTPWYHDLSEKLMKAKIRMESEHVYMAIIRKTIGYTDGNKRKEFDTISLSQFEEMTGLSQRSIRRALDDLIKRNMNVSVKKTPSLQGK